MTNTKTTVPAGHGDHPTYWMEPGVPHDAYLGEFLMRTKAAIRG
ncbi:MAG TPA: hypothetical protein VGM42_15180 [Rhodopila sp.]|jgi:hypothetical protein